MSSMKCVQCDSKRLDRQLLTVMVVYRCKSCECVMHQYKSGAVAIASKGKWGRDVSYLP
jgi:hypothetical protein